jgi:hypothetical protein
VEPTTHLRLTQLRPPAPQAVRLILAGAPASGKGTQVRAAVPRHSHPTAAATLLLSRAQAR